jgi:hypothetical protein
MAMFFTSPTAGRAGGQIYLIKNNATSSTFDGSAVVTTGSAATSLGMPTLGPTASANELAVCIITLTSSTTVTSSSGESGGDWTEAAAEDNGTVTTFDIQTAPLTAASTTISGGNATSGVSTTFRNVGFLVKELAGAADDSIATQMTVFNEGFSGYDDEVDGGYDTSGFTASPTHDEAVNIITKNTIAFEMIEWGDEDSYWEPGWAQAPPTSLGDETGQTTGRFSNNDWVDEDEPVTDGSFSSPLFSDDEYVRPPTCAALLDCCSFCEDEELTDGFTASPLQDTTVATVDDVGPQELGQVYDDDEPIIEFWTQVVQTDAFDETGETTGGRSNEDWVDEDEPIVQDWVYFQADETQPSFNDDITGTSFADVWDDDEPVTDGWLWAQYDETQPPTDDTVGPQELGQVYDDDEPIVEFWTQVVPTDQFDETGETTGARSNEDWVDEDEPVTDGWLQPVPTDQFDETGQTAGATSNNDWVDEDEPVTDGWTSTPPDQDDEYARTPVCSAGQGCEHLFEEEELADGWLASPLDDAPLTAAEVGPQEMGLVIDDDEPVIEGFTASPLEDAPPANDDITGTSNNDWVDEDEPVTDGHLCSPSEDVTEITATASITMPLLSISATGLYGIATLNKKRILPPRKHSSLVSDKKKLPTDSLAMMQSVNDALTGTTSQKMVSGAMSNVSQISLGGLQMYVGSGVPQFAAEPGSIYLNISGGAGGTMYVKESLSKSTVWVAK